MKSIKYAAFSLGLLIMDNSHAVRWPTVGGAEITRCTNYYGPCTADVYYRAWGLSYIDVEPVIARVSQTMEASLWGMHCGSGSSVTGKPFSNCNWVRNGQGHSPKLMGQCRFVSQGSWELTPDSSCSFSESEYGRHQGAGPGGECIIYGESILRSSLLATPFGLLDAQSVANSGNRFCIKPLPPTVTCNLDVPAEIDHRTVAPGGESVVQVDGAIDCGLRPVVSVVGSETVSPAPGVEVSLRPTVTSTTTVSLKSVVTVLSSAPAGAFRSSFVLVASPY